MKKTTYIAILASSFLSLTAVAAPLTGFASERSGLPMPYQQDEGLSLPGKLNEISRFLVDQLSQNSDMMNIGDNPIAVASLVDVEDFKSTNKVGMWMTENLMHELQVRGFKTVDFKTMPAIQVTQDGDFAMSKEVKELRGKYNINHILTGTYTEYPGGLMINVRVVNMNTAIVVSSAQAQLSRSHYVRLLQDLDDSRQKIVVTKKVVPGVVYQHQVELRGKQFCDTVQPCYEPSCKGIGLCSPVGN